MRKDSLSVGAIYADLKRQPGFPKRRSKGQDGLTKVYQQVTPALQQETRPTHERIMAIVGLVNLFHNGLITEDNLLRVISDIVKE